MADQDNVESNPVLAVALASVAILGVLSGFLPASVAERMGQSNEPDPIEAPALQKAEGPSDITPEAGREEARAEPADNRDAAPAAPQSVEPAAEPEQRVTGAVSPPVIQQETVPAQVPQQAWTHPPPPPPPQPVYPMVPAWGGYPPPPMYPPAYPYYPPPYY